MKLKKILKLIIILGTDLSASPCRPLQYSGVTMNSGRAMDPRTGVFTCPVPGTYLFIGKAQTGVVSS